jgi:hypothetical protein
MKAPILFESATHAELEQGAGNSAVGSRAPIGPGRAIEHRVGSAQERSLTVKDDQDGAETGGAGRELEDQLLPSRQRRAA